MSSNKTTFIVNDVDPSITSKDLSMLLGMGPDGAVAIHNDGQLTSSQPLLQYKVSVNSLDHAMTIFKKHNFTELRGNRISMEFWPKQVYINIPEVSFVPKEHISRWKIYDALQGFGTVVSIMAEPASQNHVPRLRYCVSFATKQAARNAEFSLKDPAKAFYRLGFISFFERIVITAYLISGSLLRRQKSPKGI
ncbi:hypothetical protein EDD11_007349 [Mortierella claussenii]|nr:hypothetical protein EDD11_007349 [Mortierella claussenii]